MENKISVVINTYNAERHLREVLEAVEGFDEVLVCDMESTDGTRAIAEEYGCRVVTFPKAGINIVEPARNFAIQQAAHGWVLVVDADELITPELREYLYERIRRGDCPAGLYIPRHNRFMGRYGRGWAHDYQLRFFVREGTVWPLYVHAYPTVQGRTERIPARCKMIHLADESMRQWVAKMNEYTDNEMVRKKSRRYGTWALFWRPLWRFFRAYILLGGFLNGRCGLINAGLAAQYQWTMVAKIMEKDIRNEQ